MLAPGGEPASEEWLRYRLGFFYDATYPSVVSQSADDFTWLVLFDDRCSDEFREDIESIAEDVFTPVWSHERVPPGQLRRAGGRHRRRRRS